MKEGIHPDYPAARVTAPAATPSSPAPPAATSRSTCARACHPFYTGTQKLIDTAGRVDRFRKRYEKKVAVADRRRPPRGRRSPAEAGGAQASAAAELWLPAMP